MAWREVTLGDTRWNVSLVAERVSPASRWRLMLSFRPSSRERRPVWAPYPLESSSRSALFTLADRIPNDTLAALLAQRSG